MVGGSVVHVSLVFVWWWADGFAQNADCTNGMIASIRNGYCEFDNNKPSCGYDGGDCCECTCIDDDDFDSLYDDFFCMDPSSGCFDPISVEYDNCTGRIDWI